jgi:soluble lytic murein transglycosylase-like protein
VKLKTITTGIKTWFRGLTPRAQKNVYIAVAVIVVVLLLSMCSHKAGAAPVGEKQPAAQSVSIPAASYLYRFKLEREVSTRFGNADATSRIAGQIHAESRWKSNAHSAAGAEGLGQFMPETATWLQSVCPEIGPADTWDPNWSGRATVCYDHYLHEHIADAATPCDRWAFTYSAYNGGLGWVHRDRVLASNHGADRTVWFGNVERYSERAASNITQNRNYVTEILRVYEPAYIAAGWPGKQACT